jgi:hypothetical protein
MIYDILKELEASGRLKSSSITVSRPGAVNGRAFVFGREMTGFDRKTIRFRGGETGYEELSVSLEKVLEVEAGGRVVFKRKPSIKKIYPR